MLLLKTFIFFISLFLSLGLLSTIINNIMNKEDATTSDGIMAIITLVFWSLLYYLSN